MVVFVHIPVAYGNMLQGAIGSFAYVGVMFFFMLSAYGLTVSLKTKRNYLDKFFLHRVLVLLAPFVLTSSLKVLCGLHWASGGSSFVLVLLGFYIVFYLVHTVLPKFSNSQFLLSALVMIYSLGGYVFFTFFYGKPEFWCTEAFGLELGVMAACYYPSLSKFCLTHNLWKCILLTLLGVLLGLIYISGFKYTYFWGEWLLRECLGSTLILLVISIFVYIEIGNKVTKLIGNISYEIFLLHGFFIELLVMLYPQLEGGKYICLVFLLTFLSACALRMVDVRLTKYFKSL